MTTATATATTISAAARKAQADFPGMNISRIEYVDSDGCVYVSTHAPTAIGIPFLVEVIRENGYDPREFTLRVDHIISRDPLR